MYTTSLPRARSACCALVFFLALNAFAADTPAIHIKNFGRVNDHLLRGSQPSPQGLRELAAAHVNLVLDLREPGPSAVAEKQLVESLGMKYVQLPLPAWHAATSPEIQRALSILAPDDAGTSFVHCWRGKDRTGTVIACYRIQHDGWDARRALQEAHKYGMSRVQRAMASFILEFKPQDLPHPRLN